MRDCSCEVCKSACNRKPGWFLPGEVEETSKNLGMTKEMFFKEHLSVDFFGNKKDHTFILSPAVVGVKPGGMFPFVPTGSCVFYKGGKCSIHESGKPFECRKYHHDATNFDNLAVRGRIIEEWDGRQGEEIIRNLLGRKPEMPEPSFGDLLKMVRS